jgi:hypothetical protein
VRYSELSPIEEFYAVIDRWWLIVLLMLLGGGFGWVFHRFQPPVYETKASFVVHIDFSQTGPLTEFEQDHTIGAVQSLLISFPVLEQLSAEAVSRAVQVEELGYGSSIFLERRQYNLQMRVRNPDPKQAAQIANHLGGCGI